MNKLIGVFLVLGVSSTLFGNIDCTILPKMDAIYGRDFAKKVNANQRESMKNATRNKDRKLRLMTYNMLYNAGEAEEKLPLKHRWDQRKIRLKEYLLFAQPDLIGSQELQEDQVKEVMEFLSPNYEFYGVKTRESEGRSDINAIFYKKDRFELLDAKTYAYPHDFYNNAFTYCYFRDKISDQKFVVINTKLSFGDTDRRLSEAKQLSEFSKKLPPEMPIILMGDFNTFPFIQDPRNIFFDGDYIVKVLESDKLKEARAQSIYGHFGPMCSVTNSKDTLEAFVGPELGGFILDHIFVNDRIEVFTHGIDTAKVDGEFPSDHFPVIADVYIREGSR